MASSRRVGPFGDDVLRKYFKGAKKMKIPWPPEEETGWRITSLQTHKKILYFPVLPLEQAYFAIRLQTEQLLELELETQTTKLFLFQAKPKEWTVLPYVIESHTLGEFWDSLRVPLDCTIELASFHWNLRQYRMRVIVDQEGYMTCAYKYNKNGQLISLLAYENKPYRASEDGYILRPQQLKSSAELFSLGKVFPTKKLPEGRYFPWLKNGTQEETTHE
jgi:hypothetical protein